MKLRTSLAALGIATLAGVALAWQISNPESPVDKHLPGKWIIDTEMTKQLDPDSRLAQFRELTFSDDPSVMKRMGDISKRLAGIKISLSGVMSIDTNSHPYVVSPRDGYSTLIWFHPGVDSKLGDPVSRIVTIVAAKDPLHDMLFLGAESGARNASVCFKRAESAR